MQTNVAFHMKKDTPHCVCVSVCVSAATAEAGVGGKDSVVCRPTSPPCRTTCGYADRLGICVCVCVCFLSTSTSGVSLTVEDRLAKLLGKTPADLQTALI